MRLVDLEPQWVNITPQYSGYYRYEDQHAHVDYGKTDPNHDAAYDPQQSETLTRADGVMFLCPTCFAKNGGSVGTESVLCWFADRPNVPADALPGPGRWKASGTGFNDLTLSPSVNVDHEHWHGFITNGEIK